MGGGFNPVGKLIAGNGKVCGHSGCIRLNASSESTLEGLTVVVSHREKPGYAKISVSLPKEGSIGAKGGRACHDVPREGVNEARETSAAANSAVLRGGGCVDITQNAGKGRQSAKSQVGDRGCVRG